MAGAEGLAACFAFLWLADRCRATAPVSPLVAKNSPQDCFLNAQTLSGSSPYQKKEPHFCDSFLLAGVEGLAACFALLWLADRCRATVPVSPLVAKNSPQDCFLNAQTLSGSSPYQKKSRTSATLSFWQGQKDLVSPAGSVGASAYFVCRGLHRRPAPLDTLRVPWFKICFCKKRTPFGIRFFPGRGRRT